MIEAMKQIEDALVACEIFMGSLGLKGHELHKQVCDAIEAGRQAIAEAEKQESKAYIRDVIEGLYENGDPVSVEAAELIDKLYTHPQPKEFVCSTGLCQFKQPRKPLTDEQTRKVAKLFSDRVAEMCNVNAEDHWKYHSEEVVDDVQFVLKAAHGIKE